MNTAWERIYWSFLLFVSAEVGEAPYDHGLSKTHELFLEVIKFGVQTTTSFVTLIQ